MGTPTKTSSLVSDLTGNLEHGLVALQRAGLTTRQWRRLSLDQDLLKSVMDHLNAQDVEMVGEPIEITIPANFTRGSLWDFTRQDKPGASLLRKDLFLQLRPWADKRSGFIKDRPFKEDRTVCLFKTPIFSRLKMPLGVNEELEARRLVSATPEEAMIAFMNGAYRDKGNSSTFVYDASCVWGIKGERKKQILTFGCTLGGSASLGLWDHPEIPGGSYLLTKRAENQ